jgi:UDP-glucose 4-epimerase
LALIFVTGARGAIGQHVVRIARRRGDIVAGLGHGTWTGDRELPDIDFWINGDVTADNLSEMARQAGVPDLLVHLAGGSLVGASIQHPAEDFRRTVESSQHLFEWQRTAAPDARIAIASSAAVYGDGHDGPIAESTSFSPKSPYGTHKAMVELLARSYARQFGNRLSVVRLFSVYGPGLRKQLIWEITCRLAKGERSLTLGGTGHERRDFVHIADAAQMLLDAAAVADASVPSLNGCSGLPVSVAEVVGLVASHFPQASIDFSGQARAGDPHSLAGDPSAMRKAGYATPTKLADGIAETVAWIRSNVG